MYFTYNHMWNLLLLTIRGQPNSKPQWWVTKNLKSYTVCADVEKIESSQNFPEVAQKVATAVCFKIAQKVYFCKKI